MEFEYLDRQTNSKIEDSVQSLRDLVSKVQKQMEADILTRKKLRDKEFSEHQQFLSKKFEAIDAEFLKTQENCLRNRL